MSALKVLLVQTLTLCAREADYSTDLLELYDSTIDANLLFVQIFNNKDLRLIFLHIMPSPVFNVFSETLYVSKELNKYGVSDNRDIVNIVCKFILYLKNYYGNNYSQVQSEIKKKYRLLGYDSYIYTLVENIKKNNWDMSQPKYYIISLYQNDLMNWTDILSQKY